MKKRLTIIILRILLAAFKEPFLILTPMLLLPTYLSLKVAGIGYLLLILPVARWIGNYLFDTPEHKQEIIQFEALIDEIKQE